MSSKAVSAQYGVPCPTCNVAADQPCRTRGSRRITDTHAARIAFAWSKWRTSRGAAAAEGDNQ